MFHLTHYGIQQVRMEGWKVFDLNGRQVGQVNQNGSYSLIFFRDELVARIENEWGHILSLDSRDIDGRVSHNTVELHGQHYEATMVASDLQLAAAAVCAYHIQIEEILRMINAESEASQLCEALVAFRRQQGDILVTYLKLYQFRFPSFPLSFNSSPSGRGKELQFCFKMLLFPSL